MAEHASTFLPRSQVRKSRRQMEDPDRTKEREFYRYYHRSQRSREDGLHSMLPGITSSTAPVLAPSLPVKPSDDTALTAFAQLGALRLNTCRCLISFFDRRNCYILAEATKSVSLQGGQSEFPQDALYWGTSIFTKEKSICYYTVQIPFENGSHSVDDYTKAPHLVVNDLSQDHRFKDFPFVKGPPHSRFYAGVPIRSPNGHNIGTYCVLDDKPRNGLSAFELQFLGDMAQTVMRHLEMSRATNDHQRRGVMVKSLGSFADGKSTLEEWWDSWEADTPSIMPPENAPTQRQRQPTISNSMSPGADPKHLQLLNRYDSATSSVPSLNNMDSVSPSSASAPSTVVTPASEILEPSPIEPACKTTSSAGNDKNNGVAPEVEAIFGRAAQMIVDAVEVEGAVFFDAKVSTFGGLVDDEIVSEQPPEPDKQCVILGAAHFKGPNTTESTHAYPLAESVLKHLLRNYPQGQIFNLDDELAPVANPLHEEADLASSRRSESTRSSDDEMILKEVFPQACSLVLYPLWDAHRDRWFSSLIIWSSDPMRVFTSEQELSYLSAFSNSVMAEVARLDTKLADSAKADFISSISHELRSPLHGILGMTDLLKDTRIDNQQSSHVQTIETCGKTLLDTINHVLDFAKINNLTRGTSTKRSKKRVKSTKHVISPSQAHTNDIMTIYSDVDICILIEEVLESVFAGFNFNKSTAQNFEQRPKNVEPPVSVIVDVNKHDNYVFRTQPGAWRRILMNLFGNALKYTPAGFIKIKLQVVPNKDAIEECVEFRLTVTDSGIGMSEDYINNRLFHSFAQENPLSQGTGLGLSIVKQLVELLGGEIEVHSEKGRGTKFTVNCPLKPAILSPTVSALNLEKEIANVYQRSTGKVVHFIGFDDEEEDYFPVKSLKNKNASKITKKALENLCHDWFDMKAQGYGEKDACPPDLFMATESGARFLREQYSKGPDDAPSAPVVVLCRAAALAQSTTAITVPGLIFECIAQPCGPHKLAKALESCFDRHTNRLMARATDTDSSLPTISQLSLKENSPLQIPETVYLSTSGPHRPQVKSAISAPEIRSVKHNAADSASHKPLNCIAVDDNPINLRLLRTFIEKLGHRHLLATNGVEALDTYKAVSAPSASSTTTSRPSSSTPALLPCPLVDVSHEKPKDPPFHPDVILMDINMPEMDGLEATRLIRAHERDLSLRPVTIIALTGLASSEAQQEAHASGVNLFLIKPVRLGDLEVVLRGVVAGEREGAKGE